MVTFGQTPIITMIADGDETGGTPKVLEIYAQGTVDFTLYSLENQTNGSTTWGNTFDLSSLGTVTDAFVYVYNDTFQSNSTNAFAPNFPSVTASNSVDAGTSSVLSINGDDRVRIVVTSSSAVIDSFGEDGVDGTGTAWEYKDGYAKRVNSTGPDPVFAVANWEFHKGDLDHHGAAQDGTTFESIIGLATFTPSTVTNPSLTITAPTADQVLAPTTTTTDVVFTVQNFNVANGTGDGHITYSLDGGASTDVFDTNPITLAGLASGSHSVNMELVDNAGASLSPAITASVTFTVADYTTVADVAALKASAIDGYYHLTGEIFETAKVEYTSGSMKVFAQDATGGIVIYVPAGTTTSVLNEGDGLTDIKGQFTNRNGILQVTLSEDFAMSGNNTVQTPEVVTIADFNATPTNYQSKLIRINGGTVTGYGSSDTDTEFTRNHNYHITVGADETVLRAYFSDLYSNNVALPTSTVDVAGIASEYHGAAQIYPRNANDIMVSGAVNENNIDGFKAYPNPVTDGQFYVSSDNDIEKQVIIYDILGKTVLSIETNNNQAINVAQLKAGIYMVKVVEENNVALHKLMIK